MLQGLRPKMEEKKKMTNFAGKLFCRLDKFKKKKGNHFKD